ncbi:hypothetical protein LB545_03615 [Mesorhizobium sp. BR1-1-6]|uniref:hypothetical protein n=1 Tax=Mesorhizobium sp. BR1-1-6 TaxID=2876648 RepID=UPI001CD0DE1F|nr:hypothetical protein [Mesorhizobium sp. BR1-1-6]MBZ9893419.1 hypothetical protein [Mesorhizobium sp. BR1-1-6]
MRTTLDIVASLGLAIGGVFGLAGTFVASAPLRETLWAIDGVALVVAAALLTMKYQRLGNDCVAAGFLTFLAGESLLLAGNATGLEASVPSYVGGITLWAAALVLVSAQKTFALWMRLTAVVAAWGRGADAADLLPLWEKVDRRAAPRRLRGVPAE